MSFDVAKEQDWVVFSVEDRLDAFSFQEFRHKMDKIVSDGEIKLALNLGRAQFLSLPTIKYFSGVAEGLQHRGGKFALVSTPEKLKRQIDIYATLETMKVFRCEQDWRNFF